MKKNIIIANWKMNLGPKVSLKLAEEVLKNSVNWSAESVDVVLCPTFESLTAVSEVLKDKKVVLGAQNCFWEDQGSYTGEVSPEVLDGLGCKYVIIGHSERRKYFKESDEQVNKKVKAALRNNLIPVICVGETFEERSEGKKDFVIMQQVNQALAGVDLTPDQEIIIAYEPVWVIGSGQAVDPTEAEHTSRVIRQLLMDHFSLEVMEAQTRILYGGSVNPENVLGFFSQPSINGILVGGASLQADTFIELIKAGDKN